MSIRLSLFYNKKCVEIPQEFMLLDINPTTHSVYKCIDGLVKCQAFLYYYHELYTIVHISNYDVNDEIYMICKNGNILYSMSKLELNAIELLSNEFINKIN